MTGTAVAISEKRQTLRTELERFHDSFAKVLPRHITPDRIVALTLVAATKNPAILDCSVQSVALALMQVSQWGLEIGRTVHLVPFKGQCIAIPDYKGLIEMMLRSRHIRDIKARAVYANERFIVKEGSDSYLEHEPIHDEKKRGNLMAFYAIAFFPNGRSTWEVLSVADVDGIKKRASSGNSDAWRNHFGEMGKKTAIKRLAKRIPQTADIAAALTVEDDLEAGRVPTVSASLAQSIELPARARQLAGQGRGFQYDGSDVGAESVTVPPDGDAGGDAAGDVADGPAPKDAETAELPLEDKRPKRNTNAQID